MVLGIMAPVLAKEARFKTLIQSDEELKQAYQKLFDNKTMRVRYAKNRIIVKFKKDLDEKILQKYMLKNKMQPLAKLGKRVYSCELLDANGTESINKLIDTHGLDESDPELGVDLVEDIDIDEFRKLGLNQIKKRKFKPGRIKRVHKNLVDQQWHIKNDGLNGVKTGADIGAKEAWVRSKGYGIKVAVIDTGFDTLHPDINFIDGYDVVDHDANSAAPSRSRENHGTAVAGLIAAKDDDIGVVGVAPSAQIVPIRLIPDDGMVSVSDIIQAHRKAMELDVDIINNSWSSYDPNLSSEQQLELSELETELYRELYEEANEGKGILVIFASGNSGSKDFRNSPEARSPYTLSVGATDSADRRSSFSTYGSELDLVAPGGGDKGIYTTDRVDMRVKKGESYKRVIMGYSKGDDTSDFKGTSASAPIVAGVAALVWSVNPKLKAQQVRQILVRTAEKLSGYEFVYGKNNELGYGRVNAKAAVDLAINYPVTD